MQVSENTPDIVSESLTYLPDQEKYGIILIFQISEFAANMNQIQNVVLSLKSIRNSKSLDKEIINWYTSPMMKNQITPSVD